MLNAQQILIYYILNYIDCCLKSFYLRRYPGQALCFQLFSSQLLGRRSSFVSRTSTTSFFSEYSHVWYVWNFSISTFWSRWSFWHQLCAGASKSPTIFNSVSWNLKIHSIPFIIIIIGTTTSQGLPKGCLASWCRSCHNFYFYHKLSDLDQWPAHRNQ